MKIPENISPEIAAYIKALQSENSKLQNEVSDLKTKVEKQELQISNLTEMLVNSRKKMFGKSSEKSKYFNDAQMSLFNEVEVCAEPSAPEPDKETFIAAHKRRKKRTKAELTENLNHIKQVCDLDKKECEICGGELTCIGEEFVRSELNIIPAQMYVVDIYRKVYKCEHCSDDELTNIFKAETPVSVMKRQHGNSGNCCICYAAEISAWYSADTAIEVSQRAWRRDRQQYACKLGDKKLPMV